ncbi:diguanylate cyclase [Pseudohaliea rubra]|uniref:diguanylate cyclase n=1 Tax=Pseudohaliea rubra TaxID=475795 RepID=UPI001EED96F5|nr:diguanylate cyclase [Pseudohaliea rubra]
MHGVRPIFVLSPRLSPRHLLLALLLPLFFSATGTQALNRSPSQFLVDHYGREQGLPSETVWMARQGPSGYLWLATRRGLVRFDGLKFTVFNSETHPAFSNSDVRAIEWTVDGQLWIATYGGGALRMNGDRFTPVTSDDGLASDTVYDIHVAANSSVWFATGDGVSRFRDGEFRSWDRADGLATNRSVRIAETAEGTLWFGSLTNGLSVFDGEAFRTVGVAEGLDSPEVHLLHRDRELGVLAGTQRGGAYRLADDGHIHPLALGDPLPVETLLRDGDNTLWLGTYGKGLWRQWEDGRRSAFPLAGTQLIFDLTEDRDGNLWASTVKGLFRIRSSAFLPFGKAEGVSDSTFVVTVDSEGHALAGAENAGLFSIAPDGSTREPFPILSGQSVSSLLLRDNGELWVGTFGDGLKRFADSAGGQFLGTVDGLAGKHILALVERRDGSIWVASDGGVDRWHDGVVQPAPVQQAVADTLVRHFRETSDGTLWLGTNDGLFAWNGRSVQHWSGDDGLAGTIVMAIHEDPRGILWIGSRDGGLTRREGDTLFAFGPAQGLPQPSVLAILDDGAGRLWLSGGEGLTWVERDSLDAVARGDAQAVRARLLRESDGLRAAQFQGGFQPAGARGPDGRLWLPTNGGVVSFDPSAVLAPAPQLQSHIEAVRVNGEPVPLRRPLILPADLKSLEIDYTAPQLSNAESLRFRYRVGTAGPWQDAGGRRTAYFTSLPAGKQRFTVQAAAGPGAFPETNGNSARLVLERRPRWYETPWAPLGGVLLLCLAFALAYRIFARRARDREQRLEELVNRRTQELQAALAKVEEISRIDSLTGVANRRYFEERLAATWKMAARAARPVSVIMLDIDRFKQYNDNLGHQAGDECLRQLAASLGNSGVLRDNDLVARYGGEEFVILLYDADGDGAARVARRIIEHVGALKLRHPESDISPYVTVSLGCATARAGELDDPYALVDRADQALYDAKRAGRGQLKVFADVS